MDINDVFQDVQHTTLPVRQLKPWHKARKQLIRERQWAKNLLRLIQGRRQGNRPLEVLKYFTLPGPDLLDIRYLHGTCAANDVKLQFMGVDAALEGSSDHTELMISLDEVLNLPSIESTSSIITDQFENLAALESHLLGSYRRFGPFDVVNIDLCNSMLNRSPEFTGVTLAKAVANLLQLQLSQPYKWHLYISTKVSRDEINNLALTRIIKSITENMKANGEFGELVTETFGVDLEDMEPQAGFEAVPAWENLGRIAGVALGKWILMQGCKSAPPCETFLLDAYEYKVLPQAQQADMISLAFEITPMPVPGVDGTNLVNVPQPQPINEAGLAMRIANGFKHIKDIDQLLAADMALKAQVNEQTRTLLKDARYDDEQIAACMIP